MQSEGMYRMSSWLAWKVGIADFSTPQEDVQPTLQVAFSHPLREDMSVAEMRDAAERLRQVRDILRSQGFNVSYESVGYVHNVNYSRITLGLETTESEAVLLRRAMLMMRTAAETLLSIGAGDRVPQDMQHRPKWQQKAHRDATSILERMPIVDTPAVERVVVGTKQQPILESRIRLPERLDIMLERFRQLLVHDMLHTPLLGAPSVQILSGEDWANIALRWEISQAKQAKAA